MTMFWKPINGVTTSGSPIEFDSMESGTLTRWGYVQGPPDGSNPSWSDDLGPWTPATDAAIDGTYGLRADGPQAGTGGMCASLEPGLPGFEPPRHNVYPTIGDTVQFKFRPLAVGQGQLDLRAFSQDTSFDNYYGIEFNLTNDEVYLIRDAELTARVDTVGYSLTENDVYIAELETNDTGSEFELTGRVKSENGSILFELNGIDPDRAFESGGIKFYADTDTVADVDSVDVHRNIDGEVFEDFEGATPLERWELDNSTALDVVTDRVYASLHSGYTKDPVSNSKIAGKYFDPAYQLSDFSFVFHETTSSYGGGIRLFDGNGNNILGVGTDNPQWIVSRDNVSSKSQWTVLKREQTYDRWILAEIDFDWTTNPTEFNVRLTDLYDATSHNFGPYETYGDPADVGGVEIWDYNQKNWGEGGSIDMWFEFMTTDRGIEVPPNEPPTAAYTYFPSSPSAGETITFDGTGSSDPDGSIDTWQWDFDDDNRVDTTGSTVQASYGSSGTYTAVLNVIDNGGATDTVAKNIDVEKALTVLDSFEHRDIVGNYESNNTSDWSFPTDAKDGSYSVECTELDSRYIHTYPGYGPGIPDVGDTIRVWMKPTSGGGRSELRFGINPNDPDDRYELFLENELNKFLLYRIDNGNPDRIGGVDSVSFATGNWFLLEVKWFPNGSNDLPIAVYDTNGNLIVSDDTAQDDTGNSLHDYADSGWGVRDNNALTRFDFAHVP